MIDDYDIMLQRSYGYDKEYQDNSPDWDLARQLYAHNYLEAKNKTEKIPKKIHQIWLGSELPEKYQKYTDSWKQFHPDWEYKLWRDRDIVDFPLIRRIEYNKATNQGMKSDILRYEILQQLGGIYVDTDFECLRPLDDFLYLDFFTSLSYDLEMQLYIGLIGSIPYHFIITECINSLTTSYRGDSSMIIMKSTGPYYFTKCFLSKVKNDTEGVVAFPMDFFYPLPNNIRGTLVPYLYTKPFSYAIHHWNISWLRNKKHHAIHSGE